MTGFENIIIDGAKGIFLDLDDTLYRYMPCHEAALEKCYACYNFGLSFSDFRTRYRAARDSVTNNLRPQGACRSRLFAFMVMAETVNIPSSYGVARELEEIYWSTFMSKMVLEPQAHNFLELCAKRQIPTCIITDMTANIQIRKIERLGIGPLITHLVTSEEVGAEKPDQRMFKVAAEKLGLAVDQCLMLGDNVEKDIKGATSAGAAAHLIHLPENCSFD